MAPSYKSHQALDRYRPLGRVYAFILEWKFPKNRTEPAASDLGRERAAGSDYESPAVAGGSPSITNKSQIQQTMYETEETS